MGFYLMRQELLAALIGFGQTFTRIIPISIGMAVVFTVLTSLWACNPGKPWWRKSDIVTDLCYWFFIPVITRFLRIGMLIAGAALLFGITSAQGLIDFYDNGHGPLAALPLPAQMIIFLIGEDIILYWTHRLFHGQRMWRYHAIHHSSEELEWISRRASTRSICFSAAWRPTSSCCLPASRPTYSWFSAR